MEPQLEVPQTAEQAAVEASPHPVMCRKWRVNLKQEQMWLPIQDHQLKVNKFLKQTVLEHVVGAQEIREPFSCLTLLQTKASLRFFFKTWKQK